MESDRDRFFGIIGADIICTDVFKVMTNVLNI